MSGKIFLETESTNCGANAIKALREIEKKELKPKTVILLQDPAMQKRTGASFQREWNEKAKKNIKFINYSVFVPNVYLEKTKRFVSLVMGEIPRFKRYGPEGAGYISQVDIPDKVLQAYNRLTKIIPGFDRVAQSKFATQA